jgi:hypothetical protein
MKKTLRLFFFLFVLARSSFAFGQDTISTYITSACLHALYFEGPPEYDFSRTPDSIQIWGKIGGNCGSGHIAIISRLKDTIVIMTKDTGELATCTCNFNFWMEINAESGDSMVVFNDSLIHLNQVIFGLSTLDDRSKWIDVIYDPVSKSLIVEKKSELEIKRFKIYDGTGRHILSISPQKLKVDMSRLHAGMYLLEFKLYDNSYIIKKMMKI